MQSEAVRAAAHLAILSRWHAPDSPEVLAARLRLVRAKFDAANAEVARLQQELDELVTAS